MQPETAKLLTDMDRAAERIERFTLGKSYEDYVNDDFLRSAVERQFEIIGEALSRLMKHNRDVCERITDSR